jgi:hypothetical protein
VLFLGLYNKGFLMKRINLILLFALAPLALGACASRANSIAPVAVASSDYENVSCDNARSLLVTARQTENALTRKQNNASLGDTVGVVLLLLPVGSIFGADVSGELAAAKGEVIALERRIATGC